MAEEYTRKEEDTRKYCELANYLDKTSSQSFVELLNNRNIKIARTVRKAK